MSRLAQLLLSGAFVLLATVLGAQAPGHFFHHLTAEQNLSQANNAFVYHDSRGFVWVSSIDGLNRFDGRNVRVYRPDASKPHTMLGQNIQSRFFEAPDGDLWFCTYEAVNCYRRLTDDFDHWQLVDNVTGKKIVEDYYAFLLDADGLLWLRVGDGQQGKLVHFDIRSKKFLGANLPLAGNRCFADTAPDGRVKAIYSFVLAYGELGLMRATLQLDGTWRSERFFPPSKAPPPSYYDLQTDGDSLVWLATDKGLAVFRPNTGAFEFFEPETGAVRAVESLNAQLLALSVSGKGLMFFDRVKRCCIGQTTHFQDRSSSLSDSSVDDLYLDRDSNLWVSDWRFGLNFKNLGKQKFENILLQNLDVPHRPSSNMVQALAEDLQGRVWCATRFGGLYVFNRAGGVRQYFQPTGPVLHLLCDYAGRIWVATQDAGVFLFDEKNDNFICLKGSEQLLPAGFSFLFQTQDGRVLLSQNGFFEIKNASADGKWGLEKTTLHPALEGARVPFCYHDKDGRYFCNVNAAETTVVEPNGDLYQLPFRNLKACYEEPASPIIWLATTYGLVKWNRQTKEHALYNETNGLPNQYLYAVLPDGKGFLWLSSNKGIFRFDPQTGTARPYTEADGVWEPEFYTQAWLRTRDGNIWMGNRDALNVFCPETVRDLAVIPKIQITNLKINDTDWSGDTCIMEKQRFDLHWSENTLDLAFVALEYSDPARNRLRYRLRGYDRDWVDIAPGAPGTARYVNLPSGTYLFEILAANSDGVWMPAPKQLAIKVGTPWWMTWWFRLLAVVLFAAALGAVYRYRLHQLLRVERLRNQISTDLHDDIGAALSNVNVLLELARRRLPKGHEAMPLLDRIEEEIGTSAESLDDIIWSINPVNDSMERVLSRVRLFATEIFEAKNIAGQIVFSPELQHLRLDMGRRRDFYLFFKEALNNLAKYSRCHHAKVSLELSDRLLTFEVRDDGVGFDAQNPLKEGNGLRTMRERAQKLKGQLAIQSAPGEGTRIRLSFLI